MENTFHILIKNVHGFSVGSIFEYINKEKLVCLENNAYCDQPDRIIQSCEILDKKSALLLKSLGVSSRIKLVKDAQWKDISMLDVGDECFYLMGSKTMSCCIISKHISKHGILFTIILEDGLKLDIAIDKLKSQKIPLSNSKFVDNEEKIKADLEKKTKSFVNFYEELNKPNEKRRRETVGVDNERIRKSTPSAGHKKGVNDSSSKCGCLKYIFKNTEELQIGPDEKEKFFNNLFNVLPHSFDNYDERCVLHWASYYLLTDQVQKFVTNDDFKDRKDCLGNTPLHIAVSTQVALSKETRAKRNQETIVRTLLSKDVDINIKNYQNDTPLTIVFKNVDFSLLEIILTNSKDPIMLSNHFLSEKTSILECLIKMKKQNLAGLCCSKASSNPSENELLLRSVFHALEKSYYNLSKEIIAKCVNMNSFLSDGETLLTKITKENTIPSECVSFLLHNAILDYEKPNKFKEYPLLLSCRRVMLEPVKFLLDKVPIYLSQMNDCLEETVKAYNSTYINTTYQTVKPAEQLTVAQLKHNVFQIAELLIKNGATINSKNESIKETIETCIDQDFAKAVKHLCRVNSDSNRNSSAEVGKPRIVENKIECSICMDRNINCVFSCGHTFCFICAEILHECPTCRRPITEKKNLFIP